MMHFFYFFELDEQFPIRIITQWLPSKRPEEVDKILTDILWHQMFLDWDHSTKSIEIWIEWLTYQKFNEISIW